MSDPGKTEIRILVSVPGGHEPTEYENRMSRVIQAFPEGLPNEQEEDYLFEYEERGLGFLRGQEKVYAMACLEGILVVYEKYRMNIACGRVCSRFASEAKLAGHPTWGRLYLKAATYYLNDERLDWASLELQRYADSIQAVTPRNHVRRAEKYYEAAALRITIEKDPGYCLWMSGQNYFYAGQNEMAREIFEFAAFSGVHQIKIVCGLLLCSLLAWGWDKFDALFKPPPIHFILLDLVWLTLRGISSRREITVREERIVTKDPVLRDMLLAVYAKGLLYPTAEESTEQK